MGSVHSFPARPGHDVPDPPSRGGAGRLRPPRSSAAVLAHALVLLLAFPTAAGAQLSPLLVEVRGGAALPSGDFRDGGREWDSAAPSFGADFTLVWADRWGWYVGFGQDRFECAPDRCEEEGELVATGFDLGLRVLLFSGSRIVPWVGGGALSYRGEHHRTGAISALTDRGWGWEAGAGAYLVLSERVYLNPAIRSRSFDLERGESGRLQVRAVVVDLGLVLAF